MMNWLDGIWAAARNTLLDACSDGVNLWTRGMFSQKLAGDGVFLQLCQLVDIVQLLVLFVVDLGVFDAYQLNRLFKNPNYCHLLKCGIWNICTTISIWLHKLNFYIIIYKCFLSSQNQLTWNLCDNYSIFHLLEKITREICAIELIAKVTYAS